MVRTSSKCGVFGLWSQILPWRSKSIAPQNNRDLNQGVLHRWSQFRDPSLNGSQVIMRPSKWLTLIDDTRWWTHRHMHAMPKPEGQNWSWVTSVAVSRKAPDMSFQITNSKHLLTRLNLLAVKFSSMQARNLNMLQLSPSLTRGTHLLQLRACCTKCTLQKTRKL